MCRALRSVVEVWEDYAVLRIGMKTKREMELEGPAWRKGDKKLFYSRQFSFKEIERIAEVERVSHLDAAVVLEQRRKDARLHITKLQTTLQKHGASWEEHVVPQWPA